MHPGCRSARLAHLHLGEVAGARREEIGRLEQERPALGRGERRPSRKRGGRRLHGHSCIRRCRRRSLGHDIACKRITPLENDASCGDDIFIVDQQRRVHCSLPCRSRLRRTRSKGAAGRRVSAAPVMLQ
jgi:hypothetical protein